MDAYLPCLDRDRVRGMMLGNRCLLSLRYPRWTLFLVLTFSYLSVRIRHAVAAHNGTCPLPMALSLSTLAATPSATLPNLGSTCHHSLRPLIWLPLLLYFSSVNPMSQFHHTSPLFWELANSLVPSMSEYSDCVRLVHCILCSCVLLA